MPIMKPVIAAMHTPTASARGGRTNVVDRWVSERAQLGLNTGSHFGNAGSWAVSAGSMGYWVDNTPRNTGDALVFSPGQEGASGVYGHVAVVEKVNPDGSIEISESNVQGVGVISHRTFTSAQARNFQYIHF